MLARAILIDDQPLFKTALSAIIARHFVMYTDGEHDDVKQATRKAFHNDYCLAIIADNVMSDLSCKELELRLMQQNTVTLRLIDRSVPTENMPADAIKRIIRRTDDEHTIINTVTHTMQEQHAQDGNIEILTCRENEILELVGGGMSTKRIAERLSLSPKTIDSHRDHIKKKLGIHENTQLIRFAITRNMNALHTETLH